MKNTDIARSYRDKYGIDMPTAKLARIMYEENKLAFSTVNAARSSLRYIEGKIGDWNREKQRKSEYTVKEERPRNPYNLPKSEAEDYSPFIIRGYKRLGIMSDIHLPYHNELALTTAIKKLKEIKIDALLLNGDTIDCHTLSRWAKDPKKRDFAYEMSVFKSFMEILKKQLNCKIFFKIGNHENRYEHFLMQKAHELVGIEEFEFENILKARASGIDIIASTQYMKINNLNGIHGHEYIGGAIGPVNIARGLYLRAKTSAFQGHNHQTSEHTEADMNGNITTTWSIGCLSELHPAYMPLNKWNHGFAWVELDSNGKDFEFHNKRIYNGKVL